MPERAILRYARISPRKARVVADLIRGKNVDEAFTILKFTPKKGARIIEKLLKSAVSNAERSPHIVDVDSLYIKTIYVNEGPMLKRIRPRAMGRAYLIRKRTSHIYIELDERR
ncbi:MAG: 50S ribosomal protein L22 [Thermosulfidibacteraceae bacterium]|jgi:large subunit ribosomal protein L22